MAMKQMLLLLAAAGLAVAGCSGDRVFTNAPPDRQEAGGAFITDATGKRWDVAHASTYGLVPSGFQYGLGPYQIRPLNDPEMIFPGDSEYPSASARTLVLGVELNGHVRAYPTWTAMSAFEVVNERFGGDHVAAAF